MANLELRNHIWYAVLTVPQDARERLRKLRFKKALGTSNKREAELLAAPLIARWKAEIKQARGSAGAVATEAMRWRDMLSLTTDPDDKEVLDLFLVEKAEEVEKVKGPQAASDFFDVASGDKTLTNEFFEPWKAQLDLAPKTKDQMVKDVSLFVAKFPLLESITKANVRKWVEVLAAAGKGVSSIERILSFSRNYWRYLQSHDAVPADAEPLRGVLNTSKSSKSKAKKNVPYEAADVVKLWEAATQSRVGVVKKAPFSIELSHLIKLGAYSGARIEELCSLKVSEIKDEAFMISDSKTAAGVRIVPIHSAIAPLVKSLVKASKDGYLISGLTFNKYDDRSNAIGKRFGRLKTRLGFSGAHTFHSFRSTVVTQLENAGVGENLAADIVGHEKPRITYGLYSGGATLEVKREALEKVSYPFPKPTTAT